MISEAELQPGARSAAEAEEEAAEELGEKAMPTTGEKPGKGTYKGIPGTLTDF